MITRRDFLKVTAAGGALASLGSVTEAKAAMKSARVEVHVLLPLLLPQRKQVVEFTWLAICPICVKTYAAHISTSEKQGKNCRQHLHASSFRGKISRLRFI